MGDRNRQRALSHRHGLFRRQVDPSFCLAVGDVDSGEQVVECRGGGPGEGEIDELRTHGRRVRRQHDFEERVAGLINPERRAAQRAAHGAGTIHRDVEQENPRLAEVGSCELAVPVVDLQTHLIRGRGAGRGVDIGDPFGGEIGKAEDASLIQKRGAEGDEPDLGPVRHAQEDVLGRGVAVGYGNVADAQNDAGVRQHADRCRPGPQHGCRDMVGDGRGQRVRGRARRGVRAHRVEVGFGLGRAVDR